MFIRNGQNAANTQTSSTVFDISELNKKQKQSRIHKIHKTSKTKINRFGEYISARKYYILIVSFVYLIGLIIGSVLVKNLDKKEVFDLCLSVDGYFSGINSINMTVRILSDIALNTAFLFVIYISGATVFSPFICSAFCLYKGLSGGFITGIYMIGGSTPFHLGICAVSFVLYLFVMMFFIIACSESMSFSSFLFKSEENFKNNMSFKNISVYSSRYLLFLVLTSLSVTVKTIALPLIYTALG